MIVEVNQISFSTKSCELATDFMGKGREMSQNHKMCNIFEIVENSGTFLLQIRCRFAS